jgi:hypothetical protein
VFWGLISTFIVEAFTTGFHLGKEITMSKYKAKPTIVPWLSGKADNQERRFIQIGNHLLLSKRFQQLGAGAKHLYFCMAMESGGRRSFLFPQTAALKYGIAPSSLRRYIRELEAGQFLKVYSMKNLRQPNRYEFDLGWKQISAPSARASPLATYSRSGPDWHKESPP